MSVPNDAIKIKFDLGLRRFLDTSRCAQKQTDHFTLICCHQPPAPHSGPSLNWPVSLASHFDTRR
jgi:hypothetical protein